MTTNKLLPLLAACFATCLVAAPAAAQEPRLEWAAAGRSAPMLTLGLKPVDAMFPIGLAAAQAPSFEGRPRFADWAGLRLHRSMPVAATSQDSIAFMPPAPIKLSKAAGDTTARGSAILGGQIGEYANIGMLVSGRGELGGAWTRYAPCDPALQLTCEAGMFPQLRPDLQFGVVVGGTISDRVHVNVDYDQTREFDAANNINVYYQGLADEVLQRLEVGDVSIRLPTSRYLTQGIPAGNFGFKATGQLGPLDFQTVFAQQRGDVTSREFRLAGAGSARGLVQDETLSIDDADYVKGQFFFIVDPDIINGAPHVDVPALQAIDVAESERPGISIIEVYRDERPSALNQQQQAQLGYFLGDAEMPDGSRTHRGLFKRLLQDRDYVLHSSGLWIMLRAPLRTDEALAVSYVTETGDTVGTIGAESSPAGATPKLMLVRGPAAMHQPNFTTWKYEMHNVYRVHSSSTVDLNSVQLSISLGQASSGSSFVNTTAGQLPYLKLFGLDEDAPTDALDGAQIYQPARQFGGGASSSASTAGGQQRITGTYVMFPTLRPFFEPAPLNSVRLSATDAKLALGGNANRTIYEDVDPTAREGGTRYRLNFTYRVTVEGLVSSFNLGAFGIREGSERISVGGRQLQSGADYSIDYSIGMVTLNDPQSLFAIDPDAEIRATWEQKSEFQLAPTSVFGMNARYAVGSRGELNFVGLYQNEKTIMNRPQLGTEPSAIFLGGTSARLDLGGALLDRVLSKLPGLRLGGVSGLRFTGEAAFSMPNPNTRNEAYIDDFEGGDATSLELRRRSWRLGSRPESTTGALAYLPGVLNTDNAPRLVWQHDILQDGQVTGGELPERIDADIRVAGATSREPTMWLTLGDNAHTGRRWRSITSVLSTTGVDMTRSEYLEFYLQTGDGPGKSLIFDIGTVSEDAFYYDETGANNGTHADGAPWGLGFLDEEAKLARREIWGPDLDARGLYNESCRGAGINTPPLGDASANCARNNGAPDTEDLDGNGILDGSDGSYFRYVVSLDALSQYLVRDRSATQTQYRLYRIPLHDGTAVNGASTATWRFIKHLRLTVTSATNQDIDQFQIARLRIVGSRWVKRDTDGVRRGMFRDQKGLSASTANVQVSPVSDLTEAGQYAPPPGIKDQLQDPSQGIGGSAIQYNEQGLAIKYSALAADERADVYFRYTQQPRSFLSYRQLDMWALAKRGNFGPGGNQLLIVRVGTDARNYYFYRTNLSAAVGEKGAVQADWLPQITVDFEKWFDLKAKAELALLKGEITRENPTDPYILFSEDSTYGIVFEDRARAPNLAAVREIGFGIYNGAISNSDGEIWLNDIRLASAFRDPGMAGNMSLDLHGGDFLSANLTYANQGAVFRQLNQDASYLGIGDLTFSSTANLGQMLPAGWGLEVPLTVAHVRSAQDPTLLQSSDVQAARLEGLRETGSDVTRFGMSVRKRTPSGNPLISALLDPLQLRVNYNKGTSSGITLLNEADGLDGSLAYSRDIRALDFDFVPGFIEAALRLLAPQRVEGTDFFKRVAGARLRYTPVRLNFSTEYFGQERRAYQYTSILVSDSDTAIVPIESPRKTLDSDASLQFQPFSSLTGDIALRSSRDLLPPERASSQELTRGALDAARNRLGGVDLGWETNRSLTSQLSFKPTVASWLRPSALLTSRFGTDRSASYLEIVTVGADSTAILQRRFEADRQLRRQLDFVPYGFWTSIVSDTTGFKGLVGRTLRTVQPITLAWSGTLGSEFDRNTRTPALAYQLALGDLERFRYMGIDSAAAATETGRFDAQTSVRFLRSAQIDFQYANSDLQAFDQRGGSRLENEVTWPNVRLNWSDLPLPGFLRAAIKTMSLTGSYQYKERSQALGLSRNSDRGSREFSIPFSTRMTLAGGFAAVYSGTWTDGSSDDPTGDAEHGGLSHNVTFTATFKPPKNLGERLKEPIRANLGLTQSEQRQCRVSSFGLGGTAAGCVAFLDFRNRTVNMTIDTNVSDLIVGMQLGYTARQDFVGIHRANSQFQLGIFANFELPVGQLPGVRGSERTGGGAIR